jgi:hypothetical protein
MLGCKSSGDDEPRQRKKRKNKKNEGQGGAYLDYE